MEPLLDENAERCGYEGDYEAKEPESVDGNSVSGSLEGWRGEVRHGRINEVSVEGETRNLSRKLHEDLVCELLGLLLQVLVRFDDECCDNSREQTGLLYISLEVRSTQRKNLRIQEACRCPPLCRLPCLYRPGEPSHKSLPIQCVQVRFVRAGPCPLLLSKHSVFCLSIVIITINNTI